MNLRHFLNTTLFVVLAAAFLLQPASAQTQNNSAQPQKPPKPCSSPEHRQFDFWVGDWDVTVGGKQAGTNSIQLILGDCVLLENWAGNGGVSGKSLNIYDSAKGKWQQTWVDSGGSVLELYGGFNDGAMRLTGETTGKDGRKTIERITWHPIDKDHVRQHWEQSRDGGKTWSTAFDGLYTRKK